MSSERTYGGVIWTNHALQRLHDRSIRQSDAYSTFRSPTEYKHANTPGAWIYFRTFGTRRLEVVAKKNEKKEWIILSVWSRDTDKPYYEKAKKETGFWNWFWKFWS